MSFYEIIKELYPLPMDNEGPWTLLILGGFVICGFIAVVIAAMKEREGCVIWFFLGMALGPLGVLIAIAIPKAKMKECPLCEQKIALKVVRCPYCELDLTDPDNL